MPENKTLLKSIGKMLYQKNLLSPYDGNLSFRSKEGIWITATQTYKAEIKPEDLILIDYQGKILSGTKKASSEFRLHLKIYEQRPDVQYVIHAHPLYTTLASVIKLPLVPCFTAETYLFLGLTPTASYQAPGDNQLADSILPYIAKTNMIVLSNHGVVSYGDDLIGCLDQIEKLENLSRKLLELLKLPVAIEKMVFTPDQRQELQAKKKAMALCNMDCHCDKKSCVLLKKWKQNHAQK